MNHKVVVTGLGAITGMGLNAQSLWDGLLHGRSAIRPWALADLPQFPVRYAAPVDNAAFTAAFGQQDWFNTAQERRAAFAMAASIEALQHAGLSFTDQPTRAGVALGSGVAERDPHDLLLALHNGQLSWTNLYQQRQRLNPNSGLVQSNDQPACAIARRFGLQGPVLNLSTACAGASHAIGLGLRLIRRGEVDWMLVGGADSVLNLPTMVGLHLLGAPSIADKFGDRLCRPFDRDRSGFVAAEGASMLVIESEQHARQRGARILATLAGFGSSLDAYRITAPHPEGQGASYAMQRALNDAQLNPEQIDLINAHGTSTPLNDPAETLAIKRVFAGGQHYQRLPVTANKSMLGHLIAAAGAPELIATVLSVAEGLIPPTLNLDNPDPACDLDYVPGQTRAQPIRAALSNSFGFGGLNACLAVTRYEH